MFITIAGIELIVQIISRGGKFVVIITTRWKYIVLNYNYNYNNHFSLTVYEKHTICSPFPKHCGSCLIRNEYFYDHYLYLKCFPIKHYGYLSNLVHSRVVLHFFFFFSSYKTIKPILVQISGSSVENGSILDWPKVWFA